MKKNIVTVVISLAVGFLLANSYINEYGSSLDIISVFNENNRNAFLIQQGVYSTFESMEENTSEISDYIYSVIDGMYYVYIGMTLDSENVIKLQEHYKVRNINTIVKETNLSDSDFVLFLEQCDSILRETGSSETIDELVKQVLSKYQGG